MELPRATLGRTGLEVTRLGFGAMELAPFSSDVDDARAERVLHAVLDAGIRFIDTSPDYGESEQRIGRYLSGRRESFFIASKCGCLVGRQPRREGGIPEHEFTPENVRAGVEQSLKRLRIETLDLVQFHISPSRTVLEENDAVETLLKLRGEGKLRFLGMSGTLPNLRDHIEMGVFDAFQIPYSALELEHEEALAAAAQAGAGIIVRGGVARGAPAPDHNPQQPLSFFREANQRRRDRWDTADLDELLDGMSRMEFLLRFVLSNPDAHTVIVGTANPDHLQANVRSAARGPLPPDIYAEARRRLARSPGPGRSSS